MNKSISRIVKKYIKKDLKNQVNFDAIEKHLKNLGYVVLFYDDYENADIIASYNLLEYSKTCDAFTIKSKKANLVMIDKALSSQDMLYALLHETGHIVLKHFDHNRTAVDKRVQEIEAETFTYMVLNQCNKKHIPKTLIAIALMCIMFFVLQLNINPINIVSDERTVPESYILTSADISTEQTKEIPQSVLVTPSGTKFHRSDCRYTKGKDCTTLTRSEALADYAPCSVCKP